MAQHGGGNGANHQQQQSPPPPRTKSKQQQQQNGSGAHRPSQPPQPHPRPAFVPLHGPNLPKMPPVPGGPPVMMGPQLHPGGAHPPPPPQYLPNSLAPPRPFFLPPGPMGPGSMGPGPTGPQQQHHHVGPPTPMMMMSPPPPPLPPPPGMGPGPAFHYPPPVSPVGNPPLPLPPPPPSSTILGRAGWERGLAEMLQTDGGTRALALPKYGMRLLVPRWPEDDKGKEKGSQQQQRRAVAAVEEAAPEWSDDPSLALDLGVVTVTGAGMDGAGHGGNDEDEDDEEPFVPKGYEAAPPVVLRQSPSSSSSYAGAGAPAAAAGGPTGARPPPNRATRALRIDHGAPGPYLLREVLVLPRDEPGSGVWVEVEVGGWVFSSVVGQGPVRAEAEDAPEPLQLGARDRGDVLLPPGPTEAAVSLMAEQDAEPAAVRRWLLLRLEGPGVGTPADMQVQQFVVGRRLLATVVEPNAASLLNVEAKPFVPQALREWFDRPCAGLIAFPRHPPPFQPPAFAAYLQALAQHPLPKSLADRMRDYRQQCARAAKQQQQEADGRGGGKAAGAAVPLRPNAFRTFGLTASPRSAMDALPNLRVLVELEEQQAAEDMGRYDLFSLPLRFQESGRRGVGGGGGSGEDDDGKRALLTTIVVPGAAENRPPLALGDEVRLRPATPRPSGGGEAGAGAGDTHHHHPLLEVRAVVLDRKEERVRLLLPPDFDADAFPEGTRWHARFTYERFGFRFLYEALGRLGATPEGLANATRFLFPTPDERPLPPPVVADPAAMGWINPLVNEEQQAAVMAVVNRTHGRAPFCLFGPPGTGKTLTLIEAILQVCRHLPGARVLAVAPSDVAADIVCERLAQELGPEQLFRLTWYSRRFEAMKVALLPYACWDAAVGAFSLPTEPLDARAFVASRQVVVCTCAASGVLALLRRPGLDPLRFSHVFVDESSQALQPEILVPLSLADDDTSVILAGDPKQLGPSTRNPLTTQLGLNKSLQEHLMETRAMYDVGATGAGSVVSAGRRYVVRLTKNYRSHQAIIEVPSRLFYDQSLEQRGDPALINSMTDWEMLPGNSGGKGSGKGSGKGNGGTMLGLPITPPATRDDHGQDGAGLGGRSGGGGFPVLFYGVQGEHLHELDSPSFFNPLECAKVLDLVRALVGSRRVRVGLGDIAVITAFRKQVLKLRALLREHGLGAVNVGQVEDFQGQEAKVVVISTVLSARHPREMAEQLGFLGHPKRFNVAVTRAQALTVVVGNPHALWEDTAGWRQLLEHCAAHGSYRGCDCPQLRARDVDGVEALLDAIANTSLLLGGAAASEVYPTSLEDFFSDSPWRLLL